MNIDYSVIPEIVISYKDKVKMSERPSVMYSRDANNIFQKIFVGFIQHHEEFWTMYLNKAHKVLGILQISKSGISETPVDIRIILQTALKANASSIIVCHNHPSGSLNPSQQDKSSTTKLNAACRALEISLLDHIIITDEDYYSFADNGLIYNQ